MARQDARSGRQIVLILLLFVSVFCLSLDLLLPSALARTAVEKPAIVSREEWGSKAHPIAESRKQVPVWITLHHAGEIWKSGSDPADFVRRMQIWGQNRPKLEKPPRDTYWPDLPYHFLIAPDGRIFEGRPVEFEPETNTKYSVNGNIGVEMMGDFEKQRPSKEQLVSCSRLLAWLCKNYKIDLEHIRGHMDVAVGQTDCPGKDFYRYLKDGQFKSWVAAYLKGKKVKVEPGPPLADGPFVSINEPLMPEQAPLQSDSAPPKP